MDATITHKSLAQPWAGTLAVREYTTRAAVAHDYGQARVSIPRDHPLIADTSITDVRGLQVTIQQALLGSVRYVQVGKAMRSDRGWDLTCFELAYLLKLLRVPVRPAPYRNVPAGVLMRLALTAGLAMTNIPIYPGDFAEAAPYVEEYRFDGQSVDQVKEDLMALTGQEWEITEAGTFNWIARQGTLYETPLTEGYDCCVLSDFEPEDDPVGRVVVTDQRGYTTRPYVAQEHAADLTARTLAIRADTVSSGATDQLAQSLLNQGRVVRAVGKVGLYPQGGTIVITIPGGGGGGALYGEGLYGEGVYGGGGSADLSADYPIVNAPHWAIRPGDIIRAIAPNAGIRGRHSGLYRVRGITFGDGYLYPTLDLVQEPAWTAETLPVARRISSLGASPPMTLERMILIPQQRRGQPIDAARLASPLEPNQIPVLSAISGAATAAQVPDLDDLNGQIDPLTQANWTHDTSAPTATTTRYITVNLGGTDYKITAESVS